MNNNNGNKILGSFVSYNSDVILVSLITNISMNSENFLDTNSAQTGQAKGVVLYMMNVLAWVSGKCVADVSPYTSCLSVYNL